MLKERRTHERIATTIDARFFFGNLFYSGTVSNISETGMFINTKKYIPIDSMFVVIIRLEHELLKVIGRVKRVTAENSADAGMGVELLSPSRSYLDLVSALKPC